MGREQRQTRKQTRTMEGLVPLVTIGSPLASEAGTDSGCSNTSSRYEYNNPFYRGTLNGGGGGGGGGGGSGGKPSRGALATLKSVKNVMSKGMKVQASPRPASKTGQTLDEDTAPVAAT